MLYSRRSWFALGVWGKTALLRGRPWRSFTEVLADHVESPGTKGYTQSELDELFAGFASVSYRRFVTPYDRRVAGPLAGLAGSSVRVVRRASPLACERVRLARLYLHALRSARPRQLARRATRPVRRRLTRSAVALRSARPLPEGVELWRSPAFANQALEAGVTATRLHGFHSHYGEDVLAAARQGDPEAARKAARVDRAQPAPCRRRVASVPALDPRRELGRGALARSHRSRPGAIAESLGRQLAYLARNVEDDVLGNHVIRNARALVLGGRALGDAAARKRPRTTPPRAPRTDALRTAATTSGAPSTTSSCCATCSRCGAEAPAGSTSQSSGCASSRPGSRADGAPALFNDGTLDLAPQLDLPEPDAGCRCSRRPVTPFSVSRVFGSPSTAARCTGVLARARACGRALVPALARRRAGRGRSRGRRPTSPERSETGSATAAHATVALDGRISSSSGALSDPDHCHLCGCSAPSRSPRKWSGRPGRATGARSPGTSGRSGSTTSLTCPRGRRCSAPCRWPRTQA